MAISKIGSDALAAGAPSRSQLPAGTVLQVVSTTKTDAFTSSGTSFQDVTGMSVAITPTSVSSKILILCDIYSSTTNSFTAALTRNGSQINISTVGGSLANGSFGQVLSGSANSTQIAHTYLDSPATTSSTTYSVQIKTDAGTMWVNRRGADTAFGSTSTITLMEIAA